MLEIPFEPPVQLLHLPDCEEYGVAVYMKREDTLHPYVSGNKWRKLKYVLADAKEKNKTHLVSFGGAYSNHLLALACAAHMFGFYATAFVRGEEVDNHMLRKFKVWGMQLIFVSREVYRNKQVLYDTHFANDTNAYFIDEGGRGELAAKGCEEILNEVEGFSHVMCAVGTGTTLAGIARAATLKGITAEGICVLKGAEAMDAEIAAIAGFPVKVHHEFYRGGYAKTDAQLVEFMKAFDDANGFMLDQVYTAKMAMGVVELIKSGYYKTGDRLLLIHTGGLVGNTVF
jgi:1-aminocyclopropane-1-carboxylate deaminase